MHRILWTAVVLTLTFPLGAGAVPAAEREFSDASSLAHQGVRGTDLAIQVASGLGYGLRGEHRGQHGTMPNGPTPGAGFEHPAPAPDREIRPSSPIPEPSSLLLFAGSLLLARTVARTAVRHPTP
jgi:hypothetical protein